MNSKSSNELLFTPLTIGNVILSNRVVMSPLTRLRNSRDHVPLVPMVPSHYADRASYRGTLIIAEMSMISPRASGYPHPPGIWTDEQVLAWKAVISSVHAKGSHIYLQIGCLGRAAIPEVLAEDAAVDGPAKEPIRFAAPSPIAMDQDHPVPEELTEREIQLLVQDFAKAAHRAVFEAGFDGVEVHGGYGYLIDQFCQDVSNRRTDGYGSSVENRSRFALEVMAAIVDVIGPERAAIRLSPWSSWQGMKMKDPMSQFGYLVEKLSEMKLSYLHLVEAREARIDNELGTDPASHENNDELIRLWGRTSPVILNNGFDAPSAAKAIERYSRIADIAVSFGALYMSNPDLPYRINRGIALTAPDRSKSYLVMDPDGYLTYSFSEEWKAEQGEDLRKAHTPRSMRP